MDAKYAEKSIEIYKARFEKDNRFLALTKAAIQLNQKIDVIAFDPRMNSILVANDVFVVLKEMLYCYSLALAGYEIYTDSIKKKPGTRHIPFWMNLFFSDVLYRLGAVNDKLIYCVCTYLSFKDLAKSITTPALWSELTDFEKYAPNEHLLKNTAKKLIALDKEPDWKDLKNFRNQETHRLDPKIDAYDLESHHDWSYMSRLTEDEVRKRAVQNYESGYKHEQKSIYSEKLKSSEIDFYLKQHKSNIDGYFYEQIQPTTRMAAFDDIKSKAEAYLFILIEIATELYDSLRECEPIKSMNGNPLLANGKLKKSSQPSG